MRPEYAAVFARIEACVKAAGGRQVLVAVDGQCASGKTTLGGVLRDRYGCGLFHMDDFFLRPEQRTPERLSEPGGNVDRERFRQEVLDHIADPEGLTFCRFDCGIWGLAKPEHVPYRPLVVVEGAYSQHPYFGDVYDLRFYYGVDPAEQLARILRRNGPEKLELFKTRWIPWENRYLETFGIREKSIVIGGTTVCQA